MAIVNNEGLVSIDSALQVDTKQEAETLIERLVSLEETKILNKWIALVASFDEHGIISITNIAERKILDPKIKEICNSKSESFRSSCQSCY